MHRKADSLQARPPLLSQGFRVSTTVQVRLGICTRARRSRILSASMTLKPGGFYRINITEGLAARNFA
jgi:hypothetical protein